MSAPDHSKEAAKARALYIESLSHGEFLQDWQLSLREARKPIATALRDSNFLKSIAEALHKNCGHSLVFRALLAPPVSQDQFKLLCHSWSKSSENKSKPAKPEAAQQAERIIQARLDPDLARWIKFNRPPTKADMRHLLRTVSARIAQQKVATATRNRLSLSQETAVVDLLMREGWTKLQSKLIDERAAVPTKHFMHKTRFAAEKPKSSKDGKATVIHQEVDIACGLGATNVLAMECKVTNDETNSVKRINDVLKKAAAWQKHWGNFVVTAAMLQGVIAAKDVNRLTAANVAVFWSHDLDAFKNWLSEQISE